MLRKQDFIDHGYTPGCEGCNRMRLNLSASNHNNLCRQKIEDAVSATPEGKERVEAGDGRLAEAALRASERESRISASAPPVLPEARPLSGSAG